jgi:Tol biopolymer transport system component
MSELGDDHAPSNINSRFRSGAIQKKPLRCPGSLATLPTCMAVLVILASTLTACGGGDMVSSSEAAPTITAARSPSAPSTPTVKPESSPVPTRPPTSTVEAGSVLASQTPSQTLAPTPGNCGSGFLVFLVHDNTLDGEAQTEIHLACADGSFVQRVVSVPYSVDFMSVSPGGQEIALSSNYIVHGSGGIYLIDLFGDSLTELYSERRSEIWEVDWSSDAEYIAYLKMKSTYAEYVRHIEVMHLDTQIISQFVSPEDIAADFEWALDTREISIADFDWSPDGQRIVFTAWIIGTTQTYAVYVSDVECDQSTYKCSARNPRMISDVIYDPSWSPDSSLIVGWPIHLETNTHDFLRFSNLDGQVVQEIDLDALLPGIEDVHYPVWSPDGRQIAFLAEPDESASAFDVFVLTLDDLSLINLTSDSRHQGGVEWLPLP